MQASRGLAAAHRAGLVHRDFKPSNALIDRDGLVRVTDFGLARTDEATDATSRTQSGTPAYMAPEQHRGEAVDARADQWALACSLYGALHDQQPFAGKDRAELAAAVTRGVVEPEPAGTPVPRHIRSAIRRALSPDPRERFASMDDLVRALSPVEPGGGGERGPRRRLARAALAAAGVVAVLALGIGAERGCQARGDGAAFASTAYPLVVVSDFRTRRGDPRVAATFAELLSAQLRVGDALRTPAPDARSAMLEAGGLRGASVVATASFFSRLRAATGASVLVSGEFDTTGSTLRAELQLHDAARGTPELDFRMGRLAGVVDELTRGRAIHAETGQRAGVAEADAALARVAWLQGRVTEADAAFEVAATEAAAAGESGLRAEIALDRARLAFARAAPAEKARFDEATALVAASSDARLLTLLDVHAARRALAGGDREEGRRRAKSAEESARKAHAPDAIALSLAILLDTLAPDPPRGTAGRADTGDGDASPEARESLRVELASRAEALEDLEPLIECLLALSRAARGADAVALAVRTLRLARDHGLLALEPAARRAVTHAHAGP